MANSLKIISQKLVDGQVSKMIGALIVFTEPGWSTGHVLTHIIPEVFVHTLLKLGFIIILAVAILEWVSVVLLR